MYLNAARETFEAVEVVGVPGLFSVCRIDPSTVPKGMYLYEMQTSPEDWSQPCLLGKRILVEHFGSVLTAAPIQLNENGYLDMKPGDFTMDTGADRMSVAQFEDKCFGRTSTPRQRVRHPRRHHKAHAAPAR